jgi:hypothetical protein
MPRKLTGTNKEVGLEVNAKETKYSETSSLHFLRDSLK